MSRVMRCKHVDIRHLLSMLIDRDKVGIDSNEMDEIAMPDWRQADRSSLSAEVRAAYDAYADAFARALDLGAKLMELANSDWERANPAGINGKFCRFNATNGTLTWTMARNKKPSKAYRTAGEAVPGARNLANDLEVPANNSSRVSDPVRKLSDEMIDQEQPNTVPTGLPRQGLVSPRHRRQMRSDAKDGKIILDIGTERQIGELIENPKGHKGTWIVRRDKATGWHYAEPMDGSADRSPKRGS
jgi:hypothetical protein